MYLSPALMQADPSQGLASLLRRPCAVGVGVKFVLTYDSALSSDP